MIHFASIFNPKARLWLKGRENIWSDLAEKISENEKIIWVHAASLGEFEQGRPLIEEIKKNKPDFKILLTFFSPSGYELRKNYERADYIFYLPLDTKRNAQKFISLVNPEKAIFIKYEFWYHYLTQLKKKNISTYLISAIFRDSQPFFKWYGKWYRKLLMKFDYLFVQNEASLKMLNFIGITNAEVTGDTRFDRVYKIVEQDERLELIEKFKKDALLLIGGSTWQPDEEILVQYHNNAPKKFKMIIAPHEIKKQHIDRLKNELKGNVLLYTEATIENIVHADILIINIIGLLSKIYKYGDVAFIGGAYGKGLHNTLEAAAFGMPVIFGTNYKKFQEAVAMIKIGSAHSVKNYPEAEEILDSYLHNHTLRQEKGKMNKNFIQSSLGSTQKIMGKIF